MKPELTTVGFGESWGWGCRLQASAMGRGSRDKGSGERPAGFSIRPIVSSFRSSDIHMSRVSILSFPHLVPVSRAHHLPSIGPEKEDLRGSCSVAQQDQSDMPGIRAETCVFTHLSINILTGPRLEVSRLLWPGGSSSVNQSPGASPCLPLSPTPGPLWLLNHIYPPVTANDSQVLTGCTVQDKTAAGVQV